jgi:preprotein translocase subunit SecG
MLSIAINLLLAVHIIVSLLIILAVLMQRPKSEGLGAAFGGGMTENIFGAQTTNVLQKFTRYLGILFFGLTLTLSVLYARQASSKSAIQKELLGAPAPAATPGPASASAPVAVPEVIPEPVATPASEAPAEPAATPAQPAAATTP